MADQGPWSDYTPQVSQGPWNDYAKGAPDDAPKETATDIAKDVASDAVRPLAKGAIGAITFIPDIAVDVYNMLPGDKMELPSSFWNRQLNRVTRQPTSTGGKIAEEGSSMLAGGVIAGLASVEKEGAEMVTRGVRQLTKEVKPLNRVTTKAAEDAHTAGYSLPPTYIGQSGARTAQSIAGGAKLDKEFSAGNEEVTDNLAKLALGLHPQEELSSATLERLKDEAYKPYQEVRELGQMPADPEFDDAVKAAGRQFAQRGKSYGGSYRFDSVAKEKAPYLDTHEVDSGETLDEMRALRASAKANLATYDPEKNALGYTQREIAKAMEDRIERYVKRVADIHPEDKRVGSLVADLTSARSQLAKIMTVEDSIGAGGHVRAEDFARYLDKGVPLTGPLRTIAETAKNFPKALQNVAETGQTGVWSAVDFLLGGTGIISGHPAVAGLSVARPLIRKALQSEGAQSSMIRNLRKVGKKPNAVASAAKKTLSGAAKKTAVGAAILGPEDLGQSPDLGEQQQ